MRRIRESKIVKILAVFTVVNLMVEICSPMMAYALTGGPSQPEVQSFEPVNTTQMVDLFSGDFTYNIPLMDVGGYPINISYHSGVTMDQEASWVGLGWNINPGVINRNMRGLPDDFGGDKVVKEYNIKEDVTVGVKGNSGLEFVGFPISAGVGVFYNNYKGYGVEYSVGFNLPINGIQSAGLGISSNSQTGINVSPTLSFDFGDEQGDGFGIEVGLSYNSRVGVQSLSIQSAYKIGGKNQFPMEFGQSSISFVQPPITPSISLPFQNGGFNAKLKGSLEIKSVATSFDLTGYVHTQALYKNKETVGAYGYLNNKSGQNETNALMDFNREKDAPFRKPSKEGKGGSNTLPIPSYTYDLYSISGQGVGGQFRPYNGSLGYVKDQRMTNNGTDATLSIDLGPGMGDIADVGADFTMGFSNNTSSNWEVGNSLSSKLKFSSNNNTLHEPTYFKVIGEKTIKNQSYYDDIKDINPVKIKLDGNIPYNIKTVEKLKVYEEEDFKELIDFNNNFSLGDREQRNQVISYLSNDEAKYVGLNKQIESYPVNKLIYNKCDANEIAKIKLESREGDRYPSHHIGEVDVIDPSGSRYVYGIPAYNRLKKEVGFAVDNDNADFSNATVRYAPGIDNSIENKQGRDNYFSAQTLPAYTHSYLLTGILSPDYVDRTGNGISDDDLGTAVKFNYSRVYGNPDEELYKWRMPWNRVTASYQEGYKSIDHDDRGSYTYGEKEVWHVHSIESKTMIALFKTSDREDGYDVADENGGNGKSPLKRLDKIELYSKVDLQKNGEKAKPIKTVHFKYDYELCQNADNSVADTRGKLTLKSLWFTYDKSEKGALNPYQFAYDRDKNFDYNMKHYDRWGYYKKNSDLGVAAAEYEYPYTLQNKAISDRNAAAWTMSSISLPSGGTMNIEYESDDYAYVQDKRAMNMYKVVAMSDKQDGGSDLDDYQQRLYKPDGLSYKSHNYMFIDVGEALTWTDTKEEVYEKYLKGEVFDMSSNNNDHGLYYRYKIKMQPKTDKLSDAEFVPGYATVQDWGAHDAANGIIWLELKDVSLSEQGNKRINPIARSAFQFLRLNLPGKAFPGSEPKGEGKKAILSLFSIVFDIGNMIKGFNRSCVDRRWCMEFDEDQSWVRLCDGDHIKYGGGVRVKQLTVNDDWDDMTGQSSFDYGQKFEYTTTLSSTNSNANGQIISSGIAQYEPMVGNDENPFRKPLVYQQDALLAPNNEFYTEHPFGESFFPGASIGYSNIKVSSIRDGVGYSEHEFYTAKDFPVITSKTPLNPGEDGTWDYPGLLEGLLKANYKEHMAVSQGFSIELNDMHGKPKSQKTFAENSNGIPISSTSYEYYTSGDKLRNEGITVMKENGKTENATVGKDIELMTDFREKKSFSFHSGDLINADILLFGVFPFPLISALKSSTQSETKFNSAVTTKIIRRYGILKSVTNVDEGSSVEVRNEIFDAETGEVLLTSTSNEYEDDLFSFNYPAHFAYEGMEGAYQNVGAVFNSVEFSNGKITPSSLEQYFTAGDELLILNGLDKGTKLWVVDKASTAGGTSIKRFIKEDGIAYNSSGAKSSIRIIRSGHRNMASTSIASIVSKKSPIVAGVLNPDQNQGIINTGATQYSEFWKTDCENIPVKVTSDSKPSCVCMFAFLEALVTSLNVLGGASGSKTIGDIFLDASISSIPCVGEIPSSSIYTASLDNGNIIASYGSCQIEFNRGFEWDIIINKWMAEPYDFKIVSTCEEYESTGVIKYEFGAGGSVLGIFEMKINCSSTNNPCRNISEDEPINPYTTGLLGNWRPFKSWAYNTERSAIAIAPTGVTNVKTDGVYTEFDEFWETPASGGKFTITSLLDNWIEATTITKYNTNGNDIENRDAIGIYSSAVYGYLKSLPIAVAQNARQKQIGFDGFEDYDYRSDCANPCTNRHFDFDVVEKIDVTDGGSKNSTLTRHAAHSGLHSLLVYKEDPVISFREIVEEVTNEAGVTWDTDHYNLNENGCNVKFSPDEGEYFISGWILEPGDCDDATYVDTEIEVKVDNGTSISTETFLASGMIIDGWQRVEGTFEIPSGAQSIEVTLKTNKDWAYIDDIRIQPFNSSMVTYVFNPVNLRLMAELDENNYATFYEYDEEGALIRTKKETEKGVMTIQENRRSLYKKK